jgi:glutathione S-transferase
MKLYATPLSHYSRKVRLVLDHCQIPYESIDVGNVAEGTKEKLGGNPLARIPVLVDGKTWMIESDHIAAYLTEKFDPADSLAVLTKDIFDLNARAVLNGIMAEEVKVILAKRTGVPIEQYPFFEKAFEAIRQGLEWVEENAEKFQSSGPKYRDLHLVCLWEHIEYYDLIPLTAYPKAHRIVREIARLPWVQKSAPLVLKPKT